MLVCRDLHMSFKRGAQRTQVLSGVTLRVQPRQALGVLGHAGAGKTTLLNIISNKYSPRRGSVRASGRVSWPVGFRGWLAPNLSMSENLRFIASVYGVDADAAIDFTRSFADVTKKQWFGTWSSIDPDSKGRIAFAASLAIPCDVYLLENDPTVGPRPFRERCLEALAQLKGHASLLWLGRTPQPMQRVVTDYAVLSNGRIKCFPDKRGAVEHFKTEAA